MTEEETKQLKVGDKVRYFDIPNNPGVIIYILHLPSGSTGLRVKWEDGSTGIAVAKYLERCDPQEAPNA